MRNNRFAKFLKKYDLTRSRLLLFVTFYVDDRLITTEDPNELKKIINDLIKGDSQDFKFAIAFLYVCGWKLSKRMIDQFSFTKRIIS